jgi:hypothetical protein
VDVNISVFWDVTPCSLVESTNAGEEPAAFTFRFDLEVGFEVLRAETMNNTVVSDVRRIVC